MKRDNMVKALANLPFAMIWPGDWDDIGFTERPIWVNSKGYGYIMCDEPCSTCEVEGVPLEKWRAIRGKLIDKTLQLEDIEDTSIVELLDEITHSYFDEDEDDLCEILRNLIDLPEEQIERIWGIETFDGWLFFSLQEAFNKVYERDWCDVSWDELSDEMLAEWIERLTDEGLFHGEYLVICSADDLDINFQEFIESLDNAYLNGTVGTSELAAYLQEASEQLRDYLFDIEVDTFYDELSDFYPKAKANGNISYYGSYDQFVEGTKANLQKAYKNSQIQLIAKCANGTVQTGCSLLVSDLFLEILERNTECGEFDATIGGYIESSLLQFLEASKWHFGYRCENGYYAEIQSAADYESIIEKNHPIMWFGLDGEAPIEKWAIEPGKEHGFIWVDQWYLLEYLIDDCTDCFATWYLAECGYCLPDMEEILKECPIEISEDDTVESINQKFYDFFNKLAE